MISDMGTSIARDYLQNVRLIDGAAVAVFIVDHRQRGRIRADARHHVIDPRAARNAFDLAQPR
jgi:hypothetical protein